MIAKNFRSRLIVAFAALALAGTSCDTPTMTIAEPGYDPTGIVPFIYHWRAGHEIAVYVDRTAEPTDANLANAVDQAIAAWTDVARLGEISFKVVSNLHDADVIFHHYRAPHLVEPDPEACPAFDVGVGNRTYLCISADSAPVRLALVDGFNGHVSMDVSVNSAVLDTASFFPALVIHEMGHVLGIGAHSPSAADLMFGRPRIFSPTVADATTLRYVVTHRSSVLFE